MKKIVALLMAVVTAITCLSMTAFAAETNSASTPATIEKHTIDIGLAPGDSIQADGDSGIMPIMWNQEYHTLVPRSVTLTYHFTIPDRYFAFEYSATAANGSTVETFYVELMYDVSILIAGGGGNTNGQAHKIDWINIENNGYHIFRITNQSYDTNITVHIVYYSWQ